MKRILIAAIAAVTLSLTACGHDQKSKQENVKAKVTAPSSLSVLFSHGASAVRLQPGNKAPLLLNLQHKVSAVQNDPSFRVIFQTNSGGKCTITAAKVVKVNAGKYQINRAYCQGGHYCVIPVTYNGPLAPQKVEFNAEAQDNCGHSISVPVLLELHVK